MNIIVTHISLKQTTKYNILISTLNYQLEHECRHPPKISEARTYSAHELQFRRWRLLFLNNENHATHSKKNKDFPVTNFLWYSPANTRGRVENIRGSVDVFRLVAR